MAVGGGPRGGGRWGRRRRRHRIWSQNPRADGGREGGTGEGEEGGAGAEGRGEKKNRRAGADVRAVRSPRAHAPFSKVL